MEKERTPQQQSDHERYLRNKDTIYESAQRWKRENPEKVSESGKRYYENNKEKILGRMASRRQEIAAVSRARYASLEPQKRVDIRRKFRYKLTREQLLEMFSSQEGRCGVCAIEIDFYGRNTHIDHDHRCCPGTNTCGICVRGFLCGKCNKFLGIIEDENLVRRANEYLRKSKWPRF